MSTPKILIPIPQSAFEAVRDAIGAILMTEIGNQKALTPAIVTPDKVWIERFIPPNNLTEMPFVNVRLKDGMYIDGSREITQVHGQYTFCIDISTIGKSSATGSGDTKSAKDLHTLVRLVRYILSDDKYCTLGFTPPFNAKSWVTGFEIYEPMSVSPTDMKDSTNQLDARVELQVIIPEITGSDTGVICNDVIITAILNESDEGYYFEYKQ